MVLHLSYFKSGGTSGITFTGRSVFRNRTTHLMAETNPGITPGGSLPFNPILRKRRDTRQYLQSQVSKKMTSEYKRPKWNIFQYHQEPTCLIASGILSSKQSLAKAPEPSFDHFHLGEFWQAFSLKIFCCKILILPRWLFVRSISSVLTLFKLSEKFLLYFAGGCLG